MRFRQTIHSSGEPYFSVLRQFHEGPLPNGQVSPLPRFDPRGQADVQGPGDRLLIYGVLYVHLCLKVLLPTLMVEGKGRTPLWQSINPMAHRVAQSQTPAHFPCHGPRPIAPCLWAAHMAAAFAGTQPQAHDGNRSMTRTHESRLRLSILSAPAHRQAAEGQGHQDPLCPGAGAVQGARGAGFHPARLPPRPPRRH